ncbi:MAG: gamma-butyrobetaine hydroxylase-like domain-containing protein [Candidatus Azotimanducaceae bacterium WSBS_2022_MAG_OTU7]
MAWLPGQGSLQHGKKEVQFLDIEPQGHYAIKITFSDGHDSGIFTWEYLFDLGENQQQNWEQYMTDLDAAGKSRTPQFIALGS